MPNSPYTALSPQCPNQAQWLRYRRGQSDSFETQAIENHFSDCPLCSFAVENIMQTDANELQQAWNQLPEKYIPAQALPVNTNRIIRYWKPFAAVAAVLVCIGGAYTLYRETANQTPQAIVQNKSSLNLNAQKTDTVSLSTSSKMADSRSTHSEKKLPPKNNSSILNEITTTNNTQIVAEPNSHTLAISQIEKQTETTGKTPMPLTEEMATDADIASTKDISAIENSSRKATAKKHMPNTDRRNDDLRMTEKESIIQVNQPTTTGTELYLLEQFDACIPLLKEEIKRDHTLNQTALYLADAYRKTGNIPAARNLLQKIIKQKGRYTKQAQQMLDLLDDK